MGILTNHWPLGNTGIWCEEMVIGRKQYKKLSLTLSINRTDGELARLLRPEGLWFSKEYRAVTDKPHIIMDLRNFVSWVALLKVTQVFDAMAVSDVLEIRGADPDTKQDLFKILPASTYEVLTVDDQEEAGGSFQVRIQKRT